jgi:hypothetical protein
MDTHRSADHHIHTETSSTLAAHEYGDELHQTGRSLEQQHGGDSQAPRRKATEADTLLYEDARNATAKRSSEVHDNVSPHQ